MQAPMVNKQRKNERGFTLIETSIAMVVMMVAGLAVSSLFVFSLQNNVGGNERALAMAVAQQQLEQLRSVDFNDATLNAGTTTTTVRNGGHAYTVARIITDETNANGSNKQLRKITITVTPQGGMRGNWTRSPVTLVSLRSTAASGAFLVQ
ncbi:MAG TPA: prepilin-type N-terminal cleavage/methylation domain-containing protein [Pyrinomonadaceae bacterium]|nr:prepilin-type N-terminal cleavage/methylation domain-containing protein [Pyrinomonadaceae bacterium]